MRHISGRSLGAAAIAVAALFGGCASGASIAPSAAAPSSATAPSPTIAASTAPSAVMLPAQLVGTWAGKEFEPDTGATWDTAYRIQPCRQHDEPWWAPEADQRCGEWTGEATIDGRLAQCEATLSWLEQDGDAFVFLASGPKGGAKYRTIPHPYVKIDDRWYCWDSFRVRMTPDASGTFTVEAVGAGAQAGEFTALSGTVAPNGP